MTIILTNGHESTTVDTNSNTIDIAAAAVDGIRVERSRSYRVHARRDGRMQIDGILLRPTGDEHRTRSNSGRRINAVSFFAHGLFIKALFALDARAEIRSAIATYCGVDDFALQVPLTVINVG